MSQVLVTESGLWGKLIVRILKPDNSTAGTAFFVGDEGLIITCAHVLEAARATQGGTVRAVFHATGQETTATVASEGWRPPDAEDTAFLQLLDLSWPNILICSLSGQSPKEVSDLKWLIRRTDVLFGQDW